MNIGIIYAVAAYSLWGLLLVYWKAVQTVPASEILCHRMAWSFLFVLIVLSYRNHWKWLRTALRSPITIITFLGTACFLAVNWYTYIWAVNSGYIVEASLGYFINPLINVVLGVVFLRENLRFWQWTAVGIAASGVVYLTVGYGAFPWIGLTLAFTFGFYGLLRKTAALNSLEGLSLETAMLFVPAVSCLLFLEFRGTGSFGHVEATKSILLAFTGIVTALPLLLFASAARKINLSTLGLLQYIAPTLQFLLGVLVYGESFTRARMIGFLVIWISLFIYSVEGIINKGKKLRLSLQ